MKVVALLVLLAAGALAACSKVDDGNGMRHSWTRAGVLRIAINEEPKNLNPLLAGTTPEIFVDRMMFEPLLSADPAGNPVPMLAAAVPTQANGGISRDGLTIRYRLRAARWSDGVPVTARDVIWSWKAIENANNDVVSRHGYDDIRSINAPDPRTLVVRLVRPFAPFVNTFFAESDQPYAVLPAHALATYPDINHIAFDADPNVTDGPFRFVSWERGDRVVLDANQSFFLGRPRLRRIEVHFIPDENSAIDLLRTHAIDYFYQPTIQTYPALRTLHDARIVWVAVNGFEAIALNLSHPVFADVRVRTAMAAAIDKVALARQITHGQMTVASEDLPNWIWAYDPAVRAVRFDEAASRASLAAAGWRPGADGIAEKDGRRLELLLVADAASATQRAESVLIQAALRRVGVDVNVRFYPQDVLYAPAGMGGIWHGGKFDIALYTWYSGIDPDDSSQLMCANMPPHGYNDARYCSHAMDGAQEAALSHYDRPTRKRAYAVIERLLAADNPIVYFWWERQPDAVSVDFHGFAPNPATDSWNAWQWSI